WSAAIISATPAKSLNALSLHCLMSPSSSAITVAKPVASNYQQEALATSIGKTVAKTNFGEEEFSTLKVSIGTSTSFTTILPTSRKPTIV
ncbi:hypothetical protein C0995_015740, partial [Termitomyces sp. Mi166